MGLTTTEWFAIGLSLKVALVSTVLVVPLALWAGNWLVHSRFKGKALIETLFMFPLVLPPIVTGYLLLTLLHRNSFLGALVYDLLGVKIAFAFPGAVLAAAVVSFPLVLRPVKVALEMLDPHYVQVSRSLGTGRVGTFFKVVLPMTFPGIAAGAVLGFARALGEFGATIMLAGNVAGETTTIPLAIFTAFNRADGQGAVARLVVISVIISFLALVGAELLVRRQKGA